jgi:hypothetical protein
MTHTITNLTNGVTYKSDIVASFEKAIVSEENLEQGYGSTGFWNYVSADMHMDLSTWYAATLIDEAFDYMVDLHDEDRAAEINMLEFV